MSKKLEDFIRNNKQSFEEYNPSDDLWQRIEGKLDLTHKVPARKKVFTIKTWMKAAAVIALLITTAVVSYNLNRHTDQHAPVATINSNDSDSTPTLAKRDTQQDVAADQLLIENDGPQGEVAETDTKKDKTTAPQKSTEEEELYHYVRLIEIKQGQMKELKKTEPELYKEFSKDAEMLETSYDALKTQLSKGVNSEKLLEAMIGNLKMQADLLNRQLSILKQVRTKKDKNEERYKNL